MWYTTSPPDQHEQLLQGAGRDPQTGADAPEAGTHDLVLNPPANTPQTHAGSKKAKETVPGSEYWLA